MITVNQLSVKYKNLARPALNDVSFTLKKGEFAFLIGPSGSGKSTLFRSLLRIEKIQDGTVEIGTFKVHKLPHRHIPKLRQSMGCVFQDFRLLEKRTVAENIIFSLEVIGKKESQIQKRVPEVLEYVGLTGKKDRFPGELSGGEQQRVAIARAIANKPLVLLADEPTGNLDPDTSQEVVDVIERINRNGTTILMATHDKHIVDSMRRRVIELHHGKLIRNDENGVYGISKVDP